MSAATAFRAPGYRNWYKILEKMPTGVGATLFLIVVPFLASAQTTTVNGTIRDNDRAPIPYAHIRLENPTLVAAADENGEFSIPDIPNGNRVFTVTAIGYESANTTVILTGGKQTISFTLKEDTRQLKTVVVEGASVAAEKKLEGYSVEVVDTRKLQNREVNLNQLASQLPGIRVRESGGLGSDYNYSLNGMSGKSVRFFIDGIPMDRYGSAYGIHNFPVTLVDRIEIYKGVVPPQLGSDALGGVVNLVTRNTFHNYLDVSYSLGSFNTHRAALSTRRIHERSGLYIDFQGYFNYSDNNYYVWGRGVETADPNTGRTIPIKTRRFHDAYRSASGKFDVGVADKKWADLFKASFQYADNDKEVQHGPWMSAVYGEVREETSSMSPSIHYKKKNILASGLDLTLYSSIARLNVHTTDTSSRRYNWLGEVVDEQPNNSELGSGTRGKSLLTLTSTNNFHQVTISRQLAPGHQLIAGYTYDGTVRTGDDPLISNRAAAFREPQNLHKQIASFAYEGKWMNERLSTTAWIKYYDFKATTIDVRYITDSLGYRPIGFPVKGESKKPGFGAAVTYLVGTHATLKYSMEKSVRLPGADEVLGTGLFVGPSPGLVPEESMNINVGLLLNRMPLGGVHRLSLEPSAFYRNTTNLIRYRAPETTPVGKHVNESKVRGMGASLEARYENPLVRIFTNATWTSLRNWTEHELTYKDQLPNRPYLMANAGLAVDRQNVFLENTTLSFFWDVQYVHRFYLRWPSYGNPDGKDNIPTQLVNNTGVTYSLHEGKYNISIACNNVFDEQVYDNFLLQKPGRSFTIKLRLYVH